MFIRDKSATVIDRKMTEDGYLRVTARIARTGVQNYLRHEYGLDGDPNEIIRVYRPEEEVFDEESMASFGLKPVTDNHPEDFVDARNIRKHAVGYSGETITRDGKYLKATLLITDADAIERVNQGREEISPGYSHELVFESGKTKDGERYDAIQRKIRGNHIAIVDAGRCGGECRINDSMTCDCASCRQSKKETATMSGPKEIVFDNVPVESIQDALTIAEKYRNRADEYKGLLATAHDKTVELQKSHSAEVTAKDEEIAKLKAATSDEAIAKMAEDRLSILMKASSILPGSYDDTGKSNAQIARDAVSAARGPEIVEGKTDDQCLALFEMLSADDDGQQANDAFGKRGRKANAADDGYASYKANLGKAWMNADEKAA